MIVVTFSQRIRPLISCYAAFKAIVSFTRFPIARLLNEALGILYAYRYACTMAYQFRIMTIQGAVRKTACSPTTCRCVGATYNS
ncbi:hypothetical protein ACN47E_002482 [Coniothyrium glycines]